MIYLFRMISDEDQKFCRDIVIDGSDTFLDFHHILQKNLGYDPSQLASFFITSKRWEKQQEITLVDMKHEQSLDTVTMEDTTLDQYVTGKQQRMIYVFDFFSERAFFLELLEIANQTSPKETPFIGMEKGEPPPQISLDLLEEDFDPGTEAFEDEEEDDFRLDDLDPDSLDSEFPDQ
jgi:hypothetical protein